MDDDYNVDAPPPYSTGREWKDDGLAETHSERTRTLGRLITMPQSLPAERRYKRRPISPPVAALSDALVGRARPLPTSPKKKCGSSAPSS